MEENNSGYKLKLTSIGSGSWQMFIDKIDNTSDFVRIIYGVTEQIGGGTRNFKVLRKYIISPASDKDTVFVYQFEESMMKNRRAWIAFEAVKRNKDKKGTSVGTFIALSPAQSKWQTSIGSTTPIEIKQLELSVFQEMYNSPDKISQKSHALLEK